MDIRGGDGGTSHTKNPNQIFPIIYTLSSKYLSLSLFLARFSPTVRTRSNIEPNDSRFDTTVNTRMFRRKQQVVEINDTTLTKNSRGYSFILPGFARACYQYVSLYTRCRSSFLTISLPLSSKFHTRASISPPFLRPTANLAHARFDSPKLLPPEKVTGSNHRKITDYLFQGRSLGRNKCDGQRGTMIHMDVTLEKPAETVRRSIEVSAT